MGKNDKKKVKPSADTPNAGKAEGKVESFQLIFQSKIDSDFGLGKAFFCPGDLKRNNWKVGANVCVAFGENLSALYVAWPSPTCPSGSVILHQVWNPNITGAMAKTTKALKERMVNVFGDMDSCSLLPASAVTLKWYVPPASGILGDTDNANVDMNQCFKSTLFLEYVKSCLRCVTGFPSSGFQFTITWKARPILFQVYTQDDGQDAAPTMHFSYEFDSPTPSTPNAPHTPGSSIAKGIDTDNSTKYYKKCTSTTQFRFESMKQDVDVTAVLSAPSTPAAHSPVKEAMCIEKRLSLPTAVVCFPPTLVGFGGYDEQIKTITRIISLGLRLPMAGDFPSAVLKPPKGVLLHGPPGSGKSCLVRSILDCAVVKTTVNDVVRETRMFHIVELSYSILFSSIVGDGEKELRRIFTYAHEHSPCVIVADDFDILCPSRSGASTTEQQCRIVSSLLTLVDGVLVPGQTGQGNVFLLATSSKPNLLDAAMRRPGRLDLEIELPVPGALDRRDIMHSILKQMNISLVVNGVDADSTADASNGDFVINVSDVADIAKNSHGMVGSDLLQLCKEAVFLATDSLPCQAALSTPATPLKSGKDEPVVDVDSIALKMGLLSVTDTLKDNSEREHSPLKITQFHLQQASRTVVPSALREVNIEVPMIHWNDIGGMDRVKQSLKEVVEWPLLYPDLFASMGISPPSGVLLYGPPGCSKTLMAKAVATESSMNFLAVRGPELLSKYLGDSEKAVQALFKRARSVAPAVVFFDEIDSLAGKRGTSGTGVNDRVLAQLLTELDGIQALKQVVVIAATNRPDMLDDALMRPGRIDRKILVPPPDHQSRLQIVQLQISKMAVSGDVDPDALASATAGFSGAEIVSLFSEGAMLAVHRGQESLTQVDLLAAAKSITPQITSHMMDFYQSIAEKYS